MNVKIHIFNLIALVLCNQLVFAQNTSPQNYFPNKETRTLFTKEQTFGITLHTSGVGFNFRSGKTLTAKRRQIIGFDFATYKHPKEKNTKFQGKNRNIKYGKMNSPYFFRVSYGIQQVLYDKETEKSIQIRYLLLGGPSLVLAKPYFVNVNAAFTDERIYVQKQFNETLTSDSIYDGRSNWGAGLLKTVPLPGIHLKAALSFEYAPFGEDINSLEIGANLDFLPIPIKLYAFEARRPFFLQLYISYNFGSQWY